MNDHIGARGEKLFEKLIMDFCGREEPYFRPHSLGEKREAVDFLVDLVGPGPGVAFFFVQVKTTTQGYTRQDRRLKVKVSAADVRKLRACAAPTYVVGIDMQNETGFIHAITPDGPDRFASLPTWFPLDCANLEVLWLEVGSYWEARTTGLETSHFTA
jgi:hypothetical protein